MAIFPKIQSPCPYKSQLASVMDGQTCRLCKREVIDLNGMDDAGRLAFMAGCAEEVCVSYRFPLRPAAAAALAVAMAAAPLAAAAQEPAPVEAEMEIGDIFVGGITDPANVEYIEDPGDADLAVLPVVYDDEAPAEPAAEDAPAPVKAVP